jgi:hypothetical protein
MYKNKIYWIIFILFLIFVLFYLYRYINVQEIEMFKIEKKKKVEVDIVYKLPKFKKYTFNDESINYILDDYYELDLD